jgi:hypothetical protein
MNTSIKLLASILLSILFAFSAQAQSISLKTECSGPGDETIRHIVSDAMGNIYYSGVFSDTMVASGIVVPSYFDLMPPTFDYVYLARYNNNGGANWAIPIGGPGILFVRVDDMKTDAAGNLLLVISSAILADTLHIGDLLSIPAGGPSTTVMLKIDPQGNLIWSKIFSGILNSMEINMDSQGGFYLVGWHINSIVMDTVSLNILNNKNGHFIAKGNTNGSVLWLKSFSGSISTSQNSLNSTINAQNELFISGAWEGDSLMVDALSLVNPLPGGGNYDRYIAKFDLNGNVLWLNREGGSAANNGASLQATASGGVLAFSNVLTGTSVDIDGGGTNVQGPVSLFTRYNSQGLLSWHNTIALSTGIYFGEFIGNGTDYYLPYNFSEAQITLGNTTLANRGGTNGSYDIAIAKLDTTANIISAFQIGSTEQDRCQAITFTNTNELLIGGTTSASELVIGSDTVTNSGLLTTDVFIAHLTNSVSLTEGRPIKAFTVFPNPAKGVLNFNLEGTQNKNLKMTIQNSIGQCLLKQSINAQNGSLSIDVNHLKPGVYILNVSEGNNRYSGRFIKE